MAAESCRYRPAGYDGSRSHVLLMVRCEPDHAHRRIVRPGPGEAPCTGAAELRPGLDNFGLCSSRARSFGGTLLLWQALQSGCVRRSNGASEYNQSEPPSDYPERAGYPLVRTFARRPWIGFGRLGDAINARF